MATNCDSCLSLGPRRKKKIITEDFMGHWTRVEYRLWIRNNIVEYGSPAPGSLTAPVPEHTWPWTLGCRHWSGLQSGRQKERKRKKYCVNTIFPNLDNETMPMFLGNTHILWNTEWCKKGCHVFNLTLNGNNNWHIFYTMYNVYIL